MTQHQLDSAVARATGESPRTIHALGFGPLRPHPHDLEPEDLVLAVDCPFCGRSSAFATERGVLPTLGECDRCDAFFEYHPHEIYATAADALAPAEPATA